MVATRRKSKAKPRSKFRASWRGQIRFGLVAFEVQAVNAEIKENAEVHFHLLHAPDHERIHYAKMCPTHGEVPNAEIVEGFEYAKGKYIEFEKEELDLLRSESEKALTIDAFVTADEIDPMYFDGRMYYLLPSGNGASEPYALLEAAMRRKQRYGVGQVVFSGREQLALVRPVEGVLTMAMLNYEAEIRKPADIKHEMSRVQATGRKLKLAEQLVGQWQDGEFDFSRYEDRYRQKVKQAIAAKREGSVVAAPEEEEPQVINLMDALKRSLADSGSKGTMQRKRSSTAGVKRKRASRRRRA
ncbi:MAG TPA: Ku protein [Pirellulales bacterium]|nr:Ku protein [Pirellulales bacterium]